LSGIHIQGEIRNIQRISQAGGKSLLLMSLFNDYPRVYEMK